MYRFCKSCKYLMNFRLVLCSFSRLKLSIFLPSLSYLISLDHLHPKSPFLGCFEARPSSLLLHHLRYSIPASLEIPFKFLFQFCRFAKKFERRDLLATLKGSSVVSDCWCVIPKIVIFWRGFTLSGYILHNEFHGVFVKLVLKQTPARLCSCLWPIIVLD